MTAIARGDTADTITISIDADAAFDSATVSVAYQSARRTFEGAKPGDSLAVTFSADETATFATGAFPLAVRLVTADGKTLTQSNAALQILATDDLARVRDSSASAIVIDAEGALHGLDGLPTRFTNNQLRDKLNEVIRRLGGTVAALALAAALPALAAAVQSAPLGDIYNDAQVVTNVTFDGLATTDDLAKATPHDYANVANLASNAAPKSALANYAKSADLATVATSGKYSDLSGTPAIPTVPTKVSELENDANYLKQETYSKDITGVISVFQGKIDSESTARSDADNALSDSLSAHTADTNNPHNVTAAQVGVTLADGTLTVGEQSITPLTSYSESDPTFSAWKSGTSIAAGQGARAGYQSAALGYGANAQGAGSVAISDADAYGDGSLALGYSAQASGTYSLALGYSAYNGKYGSLGLSYAPSAIYLNSKLDDHGATAKSLYEYLHYELVTTTDAAITAEDGKIYSVTADTNGVSVTLFYPEENYCSQDFVIRLAPADTNGTCIAELGNATQWQFDYPTGTNAVFGTITAPTYYTFTRTALNRLSIFTYAATKEE